MNIVKIGAGLGNQMFQYAFYCALLQHEPDSKVEVHDFKYRSHHNGYELENIFDVDPRYATEKECNRLADISKNPFSELRRKTLKIKRKTYGRVVYESELNGGYSPQILDYKNAYFVGFWQTEKYFKALETAIRANFTFKQPLEGDNARIAALARTTNSVSIHFRRGDYMKARRLQTTGSVCSPEYYRRAVEYVNVQVDDATYFVFSDDIDWVKKNFILPNARYVDVNSGNTSYRDMQLMSLCRHNIIANSSFSWWGAWLNNNSGKIVCAPDVWFRDQDMKDILPDEWVKIPTA